MKHSAKVWLIVAIICVAAGLGFLGFSLFSGGKIDWHFGNSEVKWTAVEHPVEAGFTSLSIETVSHDVRFLPSTDGKCTVTCPESEYVTYDVRVENGTLRVRMIDETHWYDHINFDFGVLPEELRTVTLVLPESALDDLRIAAVSSDVVVPADFSFRSVSSTTVSGDILLFSPVSGGITVTTTSGEIRLAELACGVARLNTVSGDMELLSVSLSSLETSTTSGEVKLTSVTAEGLVRIKTISGDVSLTLVDVPELEVTTTSGDILGMLTSPLSIRADSVSGDILVPPSEGAPAGILKTTSGDITITFAS